VLQTQVVEQVVVDMVNLVKVKENVLLIKMVVVVMVQQFQFQAVLQHTLVAVVEDMMVVIKQVIQFLHQVVEVSVVQI
jgi:hypothetical protein